MDACYDLTGKGGPDAYARCNNKGNGTHSACCANNKQYPDICLESGLCLSTTRAQMGFLYEDGCTDVTMGDDACPKVCEDVRQPDWEVSEVLQCEKDKWCCRNAGNSTNCCDDVNAQVPRSAIGWMVPSIYQAIKEANRALDNGTASNHTISNETVAGSQCGGDSTASVVGGVLGGVLMAALVGLVTVLWLWRRERRERLALLQQMGLGPAEGTHSVLSTGPQKGAGLVEADDWHQRLELPERTDGGPQPLELPAGNH